MDLAQYVDIFRARKWLILGCGAFGLLSGLIFAYLFDAPYRASSSVYLQPNLNDNASLVTQMTGYMENQTITYAELADQPLLQTRVVEELDLDYTPTFMGALVSTSTSEDSYVIEIVAITNDGQESVEVANATAAALVDHVEDAEPQLGGQPLLTMGISAVAEEATEELPRTPFYPTLGLLVGLLGGATWALAYFNRKLQNDIITAHD
ncbi:YveK family protein [Kocuria sp. UCD-OTCP]|uniref:YveK family protein n=1 Tax=Kocuria sp. UCD-OTCP TaxID=1292021 RepID=UPI0009D93B19|nr:Wzz/FepE/Etk N-terminal domain-containing protein [Kocuria sp. UCD-OTCP]